jgi:hypothetical protein
VYANKSTKHGHGEKDEKDIYLDDVSAVPTASLLATENDVERDAAAIAERSK